MWASYGRPYRARALRLVTQIGDIALQDCGNGTYKAVVKMDRAGLISIHAQINGQPLGLPATLHVLPAELHSLLMVTPPAIDTIAGTTLSRAHIHTYSLYTKCKSVRLAELHQYHFCMVCSMQMRAHVGESKCANQPPATV